jgi:hypothetical protein
VVEHEGGGIGDGLGRVNGDHSSGHNLCDGLHQAFSTHSISKRALGKGSSIDNRQPPGVRQGHTRSSGIVAFEDFKDTVSHPLDAGGDCAPVLGRRVKVNFLLTEVVRV